MAAVEKQAFPGEGWRNKRALAVVAQQEHSKRVGVCPWAPAWSLWAEAAADHAVLCVGADAVLTHLCLLYVSVHLCTILTHPCAPVGGGVPRAAAAAGVFEQCVSLNSGESAQSCSAPSSAFSALMRRPCRVQHRNTDYTPELPECAADGGARVTP
jgi:hypothetical protein